MKGRRRRRESSPKRGAAHLKSEMEGAVCEEFRIPSGSITEGEREGRGEIKSESVHAHTNADLRSHSPRRNLSVKPIFLKTAKEN